MCVLPTKKLFELNLRNIWQWVCVSPSNWNIFVRFFFLHNIEDYCCVRNFVWLCLDSINNWPMARLLDVFNPGFHRIRIGIGPKWCLCNIAKFQFGCLIAKEQFRTSLIIKLISTENHMSQKGRLAITDPKCAYESTDCNVSPSQWILVLSGTKYLQNEIYS